MRHNALLAHNSGFMKSALIVWGGWDGHEPEQVAGFFQELLVAEGFSVEVSDTLASFDDAERLNSLSLIVPIWTMGEIMWQQCDNVCRAVADHGVGLAGCHGGMCDAFRNSAEWQFLTGGQWVAHPGDDGVRYTVHIVRDNPHAVTDGLSDFEVQSEQYYLHTDPGNNVLATCEFPNANLTTDQNRLVNPCSMPTVWTRNYGTGRVFYTAIGHRRDTLEAPVSKEICRRGLIWAAK